jgi:hypothetical protein
MHKYNGGNGFAAPAEKALTHRRFSWKRSLASLVARGFCLTLVAALGLAESSQGGYHLLKKYPFGSAAGATREYFDYITVDSSARRVYL